MSATARRGSRPAMLTRSDLSGQYPLAVLSRLDVVELDRLLGALSRLHVRGTPSGAPGDLVVQFLRECHARFGPAIREVPKLDAGQWSTPQLRILRRLLPYLATRTVEERLATHYGFLFEDLSALISGAVSGNALVRDTQGVQAQRYEALLERFRCTLQGQLPTYPLEPMTALYALPGALVQTSLGGPDGEQARHAVALCAAALGCKQPHDLALSVPALDRWSSLPEAEAQDLLMRELGSIFRMATRDAALVIRTSPAVHREPHASGPVTRAHLSRLHMVSYVRPAADQTRSSSLAAVGDPSMARRLSRQAALGMRTDN